MQFREVASGLRFPEGPVALDDGSVLVVEIEGGTLARIAIDAVRVAIGREVEAALITGDTSPATLRGFRRGD